ncbi:DNA cytosine methyltransferase [Bifidobacterium catenulatum]|uniref:DNA cytosine methyltransferase n=1 Tax=Bifidobacterium catenulatum TaxID=1686 RepID=UPI003D00E5F6
MPIIIHAPTTSRSHTLSAHSAGRRFARPRILTVRRLTPLECERLQGFPDGWTDIQWRGREHAPDGSRYKALGNSMAVPVMRWIGEGIQLVEDNKELFEKDAQ